MFLFGSFTSSEILSIEKETENCGCNIVERIQQYKDKKAKLTEFILIVQNLLAELSNEQVEGIASKLCSDLYRSDTVGFSKERFILIIANGLGINKNDPNIHIYVSKFLNKYKNELICPPDKIEKDNRSKHLYKSAILKGITDLFDEMLLNDDEFKIDFNMYEIIDNKKETLLDYIDKLIASKNYNKEELQLIQMDIEDLGGKRGNELKD